MRILRHDSPGFRDAIAGLDRHAAPSEEVARTVSEVIAAVREKGDSALLNYTEKFGGPRLRASEMRVTVGELRAARKSAPAKAREAIALAHENISAFARRSLRKDWSARNAQGVRVGERFDPFARVGIYVPGGTAPLVSSALMTCTLAQVAGVPEIVVTTPAAKDGTVVPALLHALEIAGATEIYKVGGAQAIAALAHGTATISPVSKIFGPGNAYVVEAKRQVFGQVAIDLLPGPSEILIIADSSANPGWIAADMLAQAEHGHGSAVVLVTNSTRLLNDTAAEIERQAGSLQRASHLAEVLEKQTTLVLVKSLADAVALANSFSPEHLAIVTRDDEKLAAQVRTAGAIFLGGWSPVVGGDFVAGPSHELPTGGAGKSFPGLTVDQFQRRTSVVRFDEKSLRKSLPAIQTFSAIEGLDAHGRSAAIRFNL
jgi:histidinol dehydrogenase